MYTQEIMCPSCGKMTIVNVPDGQGELVTPCKHKFRCGIRIVVKTDEDGKIVKVKKKFFS